MSVEGLGSSVTGRVRAGSARRYWQAQGDAEHNLPRRPSPRAGSVLPRARQDRWAAVRDRDVGAAVRGLDPVARRGRQARLHRGPAAEDTAAAAAGRVDNIPKLDLIAALSVTCHC
jgi:hypothetical protein